MDDDEEGATVTYCTYGQCADRTVPCPSCTTIVVNSDDGEWAMNGHKRFAPEGYIWRCQACGKVSVDRYGLDGFHSPGWDESCMLNATLIANDTSPAQTRQDEDQARSRSDER
jgi:hypothetical protein